MKFECPVQFAHPLPFRARRAALSVLPALLPHCRLMQRLLLEVEQTQTPPPPEELRQSTPLHPLLCPPTVASRSQTRMILLLPALLRLHLLPHCRLMQRSPTVASRSQTQVILLLPTLLRLRLPNCRLEQRSPMGAARSQTEMRLPALLQSFHSTSLPLVHLRLIQALDEHSWVAALRVFAVIQSQCHLGKLW